MLHTQSLDQLTVTANFFELLDDLFRRLLKPFGQLRDIVREMQNAIVAGGRFLVVQQIGPKCAENVVSISLVLRQRLLNLGENDGQARIAPFRTKLKAKEQSMAHRSLSN